MSTFQSQVVPCASCGVAFQVHVLEGLHISRLPDQRRAILDERFHAFACPGCGDTTVVLTPAIYTDFDRSHYVAVEVDGDWRDHRERHRQVFDQSFLYGPGIAEGLSRSLVCRLVFGYRALREKLLLWDGGFDDRVFEAMKAVCVGPARLPMRLARVLDGGHLLCQVRLPDGSSAWHTFTNDEYATALEARRPLLDRYPWLNEEWYVDFLGAAPFAG